MAYTKTTTPIVYYGGKTAILNHILPLIPEHEVYTEVFFGGGAVFFAKKPSKNETINDRLDVVVNFYRVLKDKKLYPDLVDLIDKSLIGRQVHNEALQIIKDHKKGMEIDPVKLAWGFFMCTNFAYSNKIGGGYKYSNSMSVSVPDTLTKRKQLFHGSMVTSRIEHAYIENEDAIKILRSRNVKKAFHYVDPPYPNADQGHYAGYTWADYKKLLKWLGKECKGKFLLSSYNSRMLDCAIKMFGWHKTEIKHRLKAPRKSGDTKVEVLVRNYENVCNTLSIFE